MSETSEFKVTVSRDEYSAHLSITPAPGDVFDLPSLHRLLRNNGVSFGIKNDVLLIILQKIQNQTIIDNILVAEGIRALPGVPAEVDCKFQFSSAPKEKENGLFDFREIDRIITVKKGQILAVKKKTLKPVDGHTVTGKKIIMPPCTDIPMHAGINVKAEELGDIITFSATTEGSLKFENNALAVYPTLDIPDDVDFNVGNIHFEGNVKIGRDVMPDFIVETRGSISIWGSALSCQLKATDDIYVRSGIVGKSKGEVFAGGRISATFVENANLRAKAEISIKNGIIGSQVVCDGYIYLEQPRSRVIGSTLRAAKAITVYNAGSRFDSCCMLVTGLVPEKEQEFQKIKKFMDTKIEESRVIERKYGRAALEKRDLLRPLPQSTKDEYTRWDNLKNEIKTILKRLKQTETEMYDYSAEIRIKETLFPRVTLQIGKYKLVTEREYYHVTVRCLLEEECLVIQ